MPLMIFAVVITVGMASQMLLLSTFYDIDWSYERKIKTMWRTLWKGRIDTRAVRNGE